MGRLIKINSTQFATDTDQSQFAYSAVPRSVWFSSKLPSLRASLGGKANYNLSDRPMDHFQATEESFHPFGNREVLPFTTASELLHSISDEVNLEESRTIKAISEEGEQPFNGPIYLSIRAAEADDYTSGTQKSPHGAVWFAVGQPDSHDFKSDAIHITLVLEAARLDGLVRELIARPGSALSLRAMFSLYQARDEDRFAEYWMRQTFLLEPGYTAPIVEYDVSVVNGPVAQPEPRAAGERPPTHSSNTSETPIIVGSSSAARQMNWVIGLLTVLVLLALFK